ncbi:ankyrin repeat domain-containing protein [Serinicoccus kebangsaanensis]|uniref:ankyrin repeat domain-containing protein n=1 Tax=Serinicoccus kebangsaanensis TaxID=2602069 RepID=UPI00178C3FF8|nr:ankyrin repeat domain-containing protein [Serinicoccus kebangsaanensis]
MVEADFPEEAQLWRGRSLVSVDGGPWAKVADVEAVLAPEDEVTSLVADLSDGTTAHAVTQAGVTMLSTSAAGPWIRVDGPALLPSGFTEIDALDGSVATEEVTLDGVEFTVTRTIAGGVNGPGGYAVVIGTTWADSDGVVQHVASETVVEAEGSTVNALMVAESTDEGADPLDTIPRGGIPVEAVFAQLPRSTDSHAGAAPAEREQPSTSRPGLVLAAGTPQPLRAQPVARDFTAAADELEEVQGVRYDEDGNPILVLTGGREVPLPSTNLNAPIVPDHTDDQTPYEEISGKPGVRWIMAVSTLFGGLRLILGVEAATTVTGAFLGVGLMTLGLVLATTGLVLLFALASSEGEPHLRTFDGVSLSFQAAGEFVLVRRENFEVQARFLGNPGRATSNQAVAVRVGSHTVQTVYDDSRDTTEEGIPVLIDGEPTRLGRGGVRFDDSGFARLESGGQGRTIVVGSPSGDVIRIENLSVSQNIELQLRNGPSEGLLGSPDGDAENDLSTRDGEVMSVAELRTIDGLYGRFGGSWRVTPEERLFADGDASDYLTDEFTALPGQLASLSDFPPEAREAAEKACIDSGVAPGPLLESCTYDMLADPDEDWADQATNSATGGVVNGTEPIPSELQTESTGGVDDQLLDAASGCEADVVRDFIGEDPRLVQARDDDGRTALWVATRSGCTEVVGILLGVGAPVMATLNDDAIHPLYTAARLGHDDIVGQLLDAGARVDRPIADGATALWAASLNGQTETVARLIRAGANANTVRFSDGTTALLAAANRGNNDVVKLLLDVGADIDRADDDGASPLFAAAANEHEDTLILLLAEGADPDGSPSSRSPLHEAALRGQDDSVEAIVGAGADLDPIDVDGSRPLHFAAQRCHESTTDLLLDAGADEQATDDGGVTPLHFAAQAGCLGVVQSLVEAGAVTNAADDRGNVPADYADDPTIREILGTS